MNQHLSVLTQKEVTRKEFLGISALAVASVFGMGTLVKLLTGKSFGSTTSASGYGSSAYGGTRNH